jgi:hypothetical protein
VIEENLQHVVDVGRRFSPCRNTGSKAQEIFKLIGATWRNGTISADCRNITCHDSGGIPAQRRHTDASRFEYRDRAFDPRHRVEEMFDANLGGPMRYSNVISLVATGKHRLFDQNWSGSIAAALTIWPAASSAGVTSSAGVPVQV